MIDRQALYAVWSEVSDSPDAYLLRSLDSVAYGPVDRADRHADLNTIKHNLDSDLYDSVATFAADVRCALSLLRSSLPGSQREASTLESVFDQALTKHSLKELAACTSSPTGALQAFRAGRSKSSSHHVEFFVCSPSDSWGFESLNERLLDDPLFEIAGADIADAGPPHASPVNSGISSGGGNGSYTISFSFNHDLLAGADALSDSVLSDLLADDPPGAIDDDSGSDQCSVPSSSSEEDLVLLLDPLPSVQPPSSLPPSSSSVPLLQLAPNRDPPRGGRRKRAASGHDIDDYPPAPKSRRRRLDETVALSAAGTKITFEFDDDDHPPAADRAKRRPQRHRRRSDRVSASEVFRGTEIVHLTQAVVEDDFVDVGDASDCL